MPPATNARRAVLMTLCGLAVTALLNASQLLETASSLPFGVRRDAAMLLARPVQAASELLRLDLPRRGLQATLALRTPSVLLVQSRRVFVASASASRSAAVPVAGPAPARRMEQPAAAPAAQPAPTPVPGAPAERPPPLPAGISMWTAGDSVSGQLGNALKRYAADHGLSAESEFRVSTGLARNDVYDWPARIASETARLDPSAVILLFGANDNQHMRVGNRGLRFGTDEWRAEYARRVGSIMDDLLASGREVYWVGQPIMRDQRFAEQMAYLNVIYLEEVTKRPGASYVDAWQVFSDGQGNYAQYLPDERGQLVRVRESDGVHLTAAGGNRLAAVVLRLMAERRQPPPTPAPTPAPTPEPTPPPGGGIPRDIPIPSGPPG